MNKVTFQNNVLRGTNESGRVFQQANKGFLVILILLYAFIISPVAGHAQFVQQGDKLVGNGPAVINPYQGTSVSISGDGNTAIVGAPGYGVFYEGGAYIYTRTNGVWSQQGDKLAVTDAVGIVELGYSVSISYDGNTAIVGGAGDNNDYGASWIFTRSNGVWSEQSKLIGMGGIGNSFSHSAQGSSVGISGDGNTAIVGAQNDSFGVGAVWIFARSAGVWTQQGDKINGPRSVGYSGWGNAVALSFDGNTAIMGGSTDSSYYGAACILVRSVGAWSQQGAKLVGTGSTGVVGQGSHVAISSDGNTVIMGSVADDNDIGAAWIFTCSGGVWTQQGDKLVGTGIEGSYDAQSAGVSLSGDGNIAVVGGPLDNNYEGAVWVFTRSGGIWTQQGSKLNGTGGIDGYNTSPEQGSSVSISADGTTFIEGGAYDNENIGAVWIFKTCSPADVPTITAADSLQCGGMNNTLSIAGGNLNDNLNWQWYSGTCGGTFVGSGASISVSPTLTTTYYARGEGGCGQIGSCGSITISVIPAPTPYIYGGGPDFCGPAVIGTGVYGYYEWNDINDSHTQNITVTTSGNYTVTVMDDNGCTGSASSEITIGTITYAYAGGDQTICSNAGAINLYNASGAGVFNWSSSGDGYFNDYTFIDPTYYPGSNDILNGSVTLYLDAYDGTGDCAMSNDQMTLTIITSPYANAGGNQYLCEGAGAVTFPNAIATDEIFWITEGDGYFEDPTVQNPIYELGGSDRINGVVLFLESRDSTHQCDSVSDAMTVNISYIPIAFAGGNQTMCSTDYSFTLNNAYSDNYSFWETDGDGYFDDDNYVNATYYPGPDDLNNGSVELYITAIDSTGGCEGPVISSMTLTIMTNTNAYAGGTYTKMCSSENSINLSSATYSGIGDVLWTTTGDGYFDNPFIVNPNYIPGPQDISTQTVVLRITTTDISGQCPVSTDFTWLYIGNPPVADAGGDLMTCSDYLYIILSNASGTGSFVWSTSGDGFFTDSTQLNTAYYHGGNDRLDGSVILTLTAMDDVGSCSSVYSSLELTINPSPEFISFSNQAMCSDAASIYLNVNVTGGLYQWVTNGDGYFDNAQLLNPTYYPGIADYINGSVNLSLEADDINHLCDGISATITLTIDQPPTANAGPALTMCWSDGFVNITQATGTGVFHWETDGGGSFNNPTSLNTDYFPDQYDLDIGEIYFFLYADDPAGACQEAISITTLTIDTNFNAHAGGGLGMCASTPSIAITNASGTGFINWTTNGDGYFDSPFTLLTNYYPGPNDILNQGTTLVLTTTNPDFLCPISNDFIQLSIGTVTAANAGSDLSMCLVDEAIHITDASGSGNLEWTTSGTGVFFNPYLSSPQYLPFGTDITNLGVELYLTATDPDGICPSSIDSMHLTIDTNYNAHAGGTMFTCYNTPVTITNSSGTGTFLWTTDGNGTFDDPTLLHPTYTPGSDDIQAGNVGLILTTTNPNFICPNSQDVMSLRIGSPTAAHTLIEQTICSNDPFVEINSASATGTNFYWTTFGDGFFDNPTLLDPTYFPGFQDLNSEYASLTLTVYDDHGNCSPSISYEDLFIDAAGEITAFDDTSMCANQNSITLSQVIASGGIYSWTTSGDGSFDDPTLMNPTYYPGFNDYSNGSVQLTIVANSFNNLCTGQTANLILTIVQPPFVVAGGSIDICSSQNSVNMTNAIGTGLFMWTTSGDGYFDDPTILHPNYYPGPFDISGNFVDLYLSGTDITGTCSSYDVAELYIETAQYANAGSDQTICTGVNSITLSYATVTGTNDLNWVSSGDGSFDNSSLLHPIFYPGPWDISNGSVSLILQDIDQASICPTTGSIMVLTILPPASVSITANGSTTFCTGGSVTLDAGSFPSYIWSDGSTNETLIATTTNTYYVTVTNLEGCTGVASSSVSVFPIPSPVITASGSTTFCQGNSVTLDAGNYLDYLWSNGAISQAITATIAGTYSVTVTNGGGCTGIASQNVIVNSLPTPTITNYGSTTFCQGGSVILDAGGVYSSYHWSNGSTIESQVITTSNTYTVTVSDQNGCTGSASQMVTVNPLPVPIITPNGPTTFCQGGSVSLNAGVYSGYHWNTGANTQSIIATTSGNYSVTVTNANGCTGVASQSVSVGGANANPVINTSGPLQFCQGSNVTLTTSQPYSSYIWSNGAVTQSINVSTTGTYTVTVSNGGNCTGSTHKTVTVLVSPQPSITPVGPSVLCPGGSVTLAVGNYSTYHWNTNSAAPTILVNTGGIYTVTVSYTTGCTGVAGTIVELVSCPTPSALNTTNIAATSAEANWVQPSCAYNYTIQISKHNANVWTTYTITPNSHYYFSALARSTSYDWMIRTNCNAAQTNVSAWSTVQTFTTLAHRDADETDNSTSFNVYPNPANDRVTVRFNSDNENAAFNIRLMDMTGRDIINYVFKAVIGENQYQMNLSTVAKGVYMVILQSNDGTLQKKIIVQ